MNDEIRASMHAVSFYGRYQPS